MTFAMFREDARKFKNKEGSWSYQGTFQLLLTNTADLSRARRCGGETTSNSVTIRDGNIFYEDDKFEFSLKEEPNKTFSWGLPWIKAICKEDGSFLWVNDNFRGILAAYYRTDWELMAEEYRTLRVRLRQNPNAKTDYHRSLGGIVNAYRDLVIDYETAIRDIEELYKKKNGASA